MQPNRRSQIPNGYVVGGVVDAGFVTEKILMGCDQPGRQGYSTDEMPSFLESMIVCERTLSSNLLYPFHKPYT